jgi:type III restriction enzyme
MSDLFFAHPILNSPYEVPSRHWELDASGQPTQQIVESRRRADFITPIPKPRKARDAQATLLFDEGKGLSTESQAYDHTAVINAVRAEVDKWRKLPPPQWRITPETARLFEKSQPRPQSQPHASGAQARHRRGQDHGDGDARGRR